MKCKTPIPTTDIVHITLQNAPQAGHAAKVAEDATSTMATELKELRTRINRRIRGSLFRKSTEEVIAQYPLGSHCSLQSGQNPNIEAAISSSMDGVVRTTLRKMHALRRAALQIRQAFKNTGLIVIIVSHHHHIIIIIIYNNGIIATRPFNIVVFISYRQ